MEDLYTLGFDIEETFFWLLTSAPLSCSVMHNNDDFIPVLPVTAGVIVGLSAADVRLWIVLGSIVPLNVIRIADHVRACPLSTWVPSFRTARFASLILFELARCTLAGWDLRFWLSLFRILRYITPVPSRRPQLFSQCDAFWRRSGC